MSSTLSGQLRKLAFCEFLHSTNCWLGLALAIRKIMNKTDKGTLNSETQKLLQISDFMADVCLEKQKSILCLFSILGHKFHNVLWVDLSCIEKNVLSWAHLQKMAGAE